MTERIEFGSKAAADQFRDEHADHLCSDDDRRLKTVAIASSAPGHVLETATIEAAAGRSERGGRGGQAELTDYERESIDFSRTSVPHARSVKGLMTEQGVDDRSAVVDEYASLAKGIDRDEYMDQWYRENLSGSSELGPGQGLVAMTSLFAVMVLVEDTEMLDGAIDSIGGATAEVEA